MNSRTKFTLNNVQVEGDVEITMNDITENLELSDVLDAYDDSDGVCEWIAEKADEEDIVSLVVDNHGALDKSIAKLCERAKAGDGYAQAIIDEHFPKPAMPEHKVIQHRATSVESHTSGELYIIRAGSDESFKHPTEDDKPVVIGFVASTDQGWMVCLRLSGVTKKYTTGYESDAMQLVKALVAWDDMLIADRETAQAREIAL